MKTTTTIIGVAALTLVGFAAEALAQGPGPGNGPRCRRPELGLSTAQQQQMDQAREAVQKQTQPLRDQIEAKRKELQQLWRADRPDKGTIVRKQAEVDAIRDKLRDIRTDHRLRVHALLTPEQRAKWADGAGKGKGMGRGKGHGRRGGPDGRGAGGPGGGFGGPDCPMNAK